MKLCTLSLVAALVAAAGSAAMARPWGVGDLVVVRVGDGSVGLTSVSTAGFLHEYTTAGVQVGSAIALPSSALGSNRALTLGGSTSSEGFLTLSSNGRYLTMGGYDVGPGTLAVAGTASATVNRVVGRIDDNMVIDTSTALADAFSAGNIRSVCSDNGTNFWVGGNNQGVRYAAFGAASSTQVLATPANARVTNIFSSQLYTSSGSSPFIGVSSISGGLPTTAGQTATLLVPDGGTTPSPYDYFYSDANTVYVADDRTIVNGGGIQKYVFSAGSWSLAYTLTNTLSAGVRGLCGVVDPTGAVTLYATTAQSNANQLVTVTDGGVASPCTILATAAANTAFRGVDFAPVPSPATIGLVGLAGLLAAKRLRC